MNINLVMFLLERVGLILGFCMLVPLAIAQSCGESGLCMFGIPLVLTVGASVCLPSSLPKRRRMTLREGVVLVGGTVAFTCLFGALPYVFGGYDMLTALFESISGFTTTGASNIADLSAMPRSLIFWRSMMQWLGGISTLLVLLIIVPQVGSGAMRFFIAELRHESVERLLGGVGRTVRSVCGLYLLVTAVAGAVLMLFNMSWLEAFCYAMAAVSTGGFVPNVGGLMLLDNRGAEVTLLVVMLLAGGNHSLYYHAYRNGWRALLKDTEFKGYAGALVFITMTLAWELLYAGTYAPGDCLFYALFQTTSLITTTGFAVQDYTRWSDFSRFTLFVMMFVGGCSCSAAGGIKISRLLVLFKLSWAEMRRTVHPNMMIAVKMSGINVSPVAIVNITRFFFLYIASFVILILVMAAVTDYTMFGTIGAVASCMANIGPAFENVSPIRSYADMGALGKLTACLAMLLGRLEIFSFLVLLTPDFWHSRRKW